jgi:hypothetical protein
MSYAQSLAIYMKTYLPILQLFARQDYFSGISLRFKVTGKDWDSFLAFSWSLTTKVYRYLEHRTLNLSPPFGCFLMVTIFASFLRAVRRNSLMSWICFG